MVKTEKRQQLIYSILNQILKTGFADLKMEDFVKMVPASRATLYRYFSSRENIIKEVVKEYLKYIDRFKIPFNANNEREWLQELESQLEEALILNSHLSPIFLQDLKTEFPVQYNLLYGKISDHNTDLIKFFKDGQKADVFNPSRPELWILQDRLMIPRISDPAYLLNHNLTIKEAINSYIVMKRNQIVKPQYLDQFDSSFTNSVIEKMKREINFKDR